MATRPRAVDDYLRELERALRDVPSDRRTEIVGEIGAHVDALLAERASPPSAADTLNVLERVGRPEEIARDVRDQFDPAPRGRRWTDVVAVVVLPFPFFGWIVGGVLVWMSDAWSTREKAVGTLAWPGLLVVGLLMIVGSSGAAGSGDEGGLGPFEQLVLMVLFLGPLAGAIYLARKLRTPQGHAGGLAGAR